MLFPVVHSVSGSSLKNMTFIAMKLKGQILFFLVGLLSETTACLVVADYQYGLSVYAICE